MLKFYFLLYFVFSIILYSEEKIDIGNDYMFQEFLKDLKSDWKMQILENKILLFKRIEPVLVLPTNKLSKKIELESDENRILRFKKFGMKQNPFLKYKILPKLNILEDINQEILSEQITDEIKSLRTKYKIDSIIDKKLSSSGFEIYNPKTKKEKSNLKLYLKKVSIYQKKIPMKMDYKFDKFGLALIEKKGMSSQYTDIFPDSVVGEFLQIEKALLKYKVYRQIE